MPAHLTRPFIAALTCTTSIILCSQADAAFSWTSAATFNVHADSPGGLDLDSGTVWGIPGSQTVWSESSFEQDGFNWCTSYAEGFSSVWGTADGIATTTRAGGVATGTGSFLTAASSYAFSLRSIWLNSDQDISIGVSVHVSELDAGGSWSAEFAGVTLSEGYTIINLGAGTHIGSIYADMYCYANGGGFFQNAQVDVSFTVIPVPAPAAGAVFALVAPLCGARRRRA